MAALIGIVMYLRYANLVSNILGFALFQISMIVAMVVSIYSRRTFSQYSKIPLKKYYVIGIIAGIVIVAAIFLLT